MSLPPVAPHVLAEAVDALPARLRKRLDETVDLARSWPVESTPDGVVAAGGGDSRRGDWRPAP